MGNLINKIGNSEILEVTIKSLEIWSNENKVKCYKTVGGDSEGNN